MKKENKHHLGVETPTPPVRSETGKRTLTREQEAELGRRVEEGERLILRALAQSPIALGELGAIGRELEAGDVCVSDVLRSADHADDEVARRLADALALAGALARGLAGALARGEDTQAKRRLLEELELLRLHRRTLDRVAGALRAAPRNTSTRRRLAAVEKGRRFADDAKAELVNANVGLVTMLAKRFAGRGLALHDLVQEGNLGLMKAVDKFDHHRGLRFGTYAMWWVRHQINRAITDQAKTIRVPAHLTATRQRVRRLSRTFEATHGREPTEAELGEQSGLVPEKVRAALAPSLEPLSLDTPAREDRDTRLGELIPDRSTLAPDEQIAEIHMRAQTVRLLEHLTPREQDVLRRRFGLDDAPEQTLAEIGASLSVSRERVRQIEAEALRKLRQPSQAGELDSYLAVG
ncbi:RNA polymerase sigma factor RpoD [Minicystis rosea]|nr:RNA polymerase sigma factor RpoD [Minicystis rosea]